MHEANKISDALPYWLALTLTPGIGPIRFRTLLEHYPTLQTLFSDPHSLEHAFPKRDTTTLQSALKQTNWKNIDSLLRWAEDPDHHILTFMHPAYPTLLKELNDAPPVLYAQGQLSAFEPPAIAIVGSRHPTPLGRRAAQQFSQQLANTGFAITSGLALGIDHYAHQGALASSAATLAVLGSGLDCIYPSQNQKLAEAIRQQGVIISEFTPNTEPKPKHFPRRNRIISGLSLGVLVVEAGLRSGSLITARLAAEQGREVFAVPGSIYNMLTRGNHQLIRDGAKLVEKIEDIIVELEQFCTIQHTNEASLHNHTNNGGLSSSQQKILELVKLGPISVDNLIEQSGLTPKEVSSILLAFELQGLVSSSLGGVYTLHGKED